MQETENKSLVEELFANVEPSLVDRLGEFYEEGATFRDPVNEAKGLEKIEAMYRDLFKNLKGIRMVVEDSGAGANATFYRWVMTYKFRGKERKIDGVSEIELGASGKIVRQIDFWDASHVVYGEFPGLGLALRGIQKLVRVK